MHQILPAAIRYSGDLAAGINQKRQALGDKITALVETSLTERISTCCNRLYESAEKLHRDLKSVPRESNQISADYYCDVIVPGMEQIRKDADLLEKLTPKAYWPYPTYSDMLFY